ncbi:hypothetical protein [Chroococcidiopsis sp.]|uniref:hypothetical protein n=1 Tax=Chroococcidiopsis sp. TaxID=3088168 RepID=UPI003F2FFB27
MPEPTPIAPITTIERLKASAETVESVLTIELEKLRSMLEGIQTLKKQETPLKKRIAVLELALSKLVSDAPVSTDPPARNTVPKHVPPQEDAELDGIDLSDFSDLDPPSE